MVGDLEAITKQNSAPAVAPHRILTFGGGDVSQTRDQEAAFRLGRGPARLGQTAPALAQA